MTSYFDYAIGQIGAVWKMATNDPRWRDELDYSVDGVFRSFSAANVAVPLAVALYWLSWRAADVAVSNAEDLGLAASPLLQGAAIGYIATMVVAYAAEWAASLGFLAIAARGLKAERRIAPAIVGYNWAQPPITLIQAIAMGGVAVSESTQIASVLALPALVLQILILWGVLRRGLDRKVGETLAVLFGLIFVSIAVTTLVGAVGAAVAA
ncbi:MAG: hypothetical protein GC152_00125 [Alphaproteobacteria bacterium]|nr:hypothetical protein [Alphaproteobacteria bacterium]